VNEYAIFVTSGNRHYGLAETLARERS